jgi:hypothetical protein
MSICGFLSDRSRRRADLVMRRVRMLERLETRKLASMRVAIWVDVMSRDAGCMMTVSIFLSRDGGVKGP